MNLFIPLGLFGPWQIIALFIVLGILAGIIVLIVKLATKNSPTPMQEQPKEDPLERLDRLNKLRESGALTEVEFEIEKRKILNN